MKKYLNRLKKLFPNQRVIQKISKTILLTVLPLMFLTSIVILSNKNKNNIDKVMAATPNLVGYWNFDEGAGTVVSDSSGNNNTGTLTNGPLWTAGKVGNALNFDGTNDYVSIPIILP